MKKHFYLLILFFVVAYGSQAQIKKGDVLLGGTLSFGTQKNTSDTDPNQVNKQTNFTITPSIGKAIKDNLLLGFDLNFTGISNTQGNGTGDFSSKLHNYGAGVFLRKYQPLGSSGFAIFMQTRFGGSYNTQSNQSGGVPNPYNKVRGYSFDLSFYPGIAYAITKRVQLETGFANLADINYNHSKTTYTTGVNNDVIATTKSNSFGIATSLSNGVGFAVGIKVLLGS